jgi:raffinose/stachyose/melibiose transport system substrate-binding protein
MMLRKTVVCAIVAALVIVPSPAVAQTPVTLRVMHWTNSMVKGSDWWDQITGGFEQAHPGVTIESNYVAFPQYLPSLEAMTAGGELPDVFFGHVKSAELGRAGVAVNYKDVFADAFFANFFPGPLRQFTFDNGSVYAVPWTAQIFGVFANDTIMDQLGLKAPDTWDELVAMAPTIKAAGYVPLVWGNQARNVCPDFLLPLVTQSGGDVYALDDLTNPNISWDSQPVKDALALLQRLSKAGVFIDGINGVSENQGWQIAYQGKAAMLYTGSWVPSDIETNAPRDFADHYSVHKVPALKAGDVHWTGDGSGEGWVVNAKGPNKDLAIEFLRYLFSDQVYPSHITGAQNMPSMPTAVDRLTNKKVQEMTGWLTTDGTDHILFGQGSWDAVSNVCQAILDGSTTPEQGAAQIQRDVLATRSHS